MNRVDYNLPSGIYQNVPPSGITQSSQDTLKFLQQFTQTKQETLLDSAYYRNTPNFSMSDNLTRLPVEHFPDMYFAEPHPERYVGLTESNGYFPSADKFQIPDTNESIDDLIKRIMLGNNPSLLLEMFPENKPYLQGIGNYLSSPNK